MDGNRNAPHRPSRTVRDREGTRNELPVERAPSRVISARAASGGRQRGAARFGDAALLQTRRSLLRSAFWSGFGVSGAGLLLGFLQFFWPRKVSGFGAIVRVPAGAVPKPGDPPKRFVDGKFYLVNLRPGEGVPAKYRSSLAPAEPGGILALWQKCPHLGCTVPWRPEFQHDGVSAWFRCPCHGSTYTRAGVRVWGPATRSMDTFAVKLNSDGSLDVDTSKVTNGGPDNPQRAALP